MKNLQKFFVIVAALLLLGGINQTLADDSTKVDSVGNSMVNFENFYHVWGLIQTYYFKGSVDSDTLLNGAIKGMVQSLDPYSDFFTPQEMRQFSKMLAKPEDYAGIGAYLKLKKRDIIFTGFIPNSPAKKALRLGDKLITINDSIDVDTLTLEEACEILLGQAGTKVVLGIKRGKKDLRITLTRALTHPKTVELRIKNDIAYLKLKEFNTVATQEFGMAARQILVANEKKPLKGLILDLRDNPGGFLDAAVRLNMLWVGSRAAVIERYANGGEDTLKPVMAIYNWEPPLANFKTIVLQNEYTAPASEVLIGALQDYGKIITVGTKSYGKGCVQQVFPFPDGSGLKLTTAYWLTPKGRLIHGKGFEPDYRVDFTMKDYEKGRDPQIEKAIQILKDSK